MDTNKPVAKYDHERRLLLAERKPELMAALHSANRELKNARRTGKPRVIKNAERFLALKEKELEAILNGHFLDETSARVLIQIRLDAKTKSVV